MAEVYLVRHGQTAWNAEKRFRGRHDLPLNDAGRAEAERVAGTLADTALRRVYASPLSRAMETAAMVSRSRGLEVLADAAFVDIDYGRWTGLSDAEARGEFPELHLRWQRRPEQVRFPDGESLDDVRLRAVSRLRKLALAHAGEAIAIVSHRVVIKVLLAAVKGLGNAHFWRIQMDTGAIAGLRTTGATLQLAIENETGHLAGLEGHDSVDF